MKKVIKKNELYENMQDAINLLCDTVKVTSGPKGDNVIINDEILGPYITNDGVTIAKNISSDDKVIDTILEIAKTSSIKTNELVGDGTTTTLIFLQVLFNKGLDLVKRGKNPFALSKLLKKRLEFIILKLQKLAIKANLEMLKNIAITSSNDEQIGLLVSDAYSKIKNKEGIIIKESSDVKDRLIFTKGYIMETVIASSYFFGKEKRIELSNTKLLLVNNCIADLELLSGIINQTIEEESSLVIVAKDYTEDVINRVLELYLEYKINIILLKLPEYGTHQTDILKDLEVVGSCQYINSLHNIDYNCLGNITSISIDNNETIISYENNQNIKNYLTKLEEYLTCESQEMEREFISRRIALFRCGIAYLEVGGYTSIEMKERKMRFIDALCAISNSSYVLLGGGVSALHVASYLKDDEIDKIFKEALKAPFYQILKNCGANILNVEQKITNSDFQVIYNVKNEKYEDSKSTTVYDSLNVIVSSLQNAISIACSLLSTSSLVMNEIKEEKNYENI